MRLACRGVEEIGGDAHSPSDGTYYVYLRYRNDNSFWQGTYVTIDNEAYSYYSAWQKGYTDWTWIQTKSAELTAGTHTVKITARKTGNYIDMIYVTKKTAFNGLNSVNTVIEAESGAYHSSGNEIIVKSDDANASGGSYLKTNLAANRDVPAGDGEELYADYTYDINIPADGKYYIYLRYKNSNAYWQGTYVTFDNIAYSYYSGWQKGYTDWTWIQTNSAELTAGAHTVKITARKGGNDIDAIYVTKNDKFNGFFETETLIEAEAGAYHSTGSEFVVKSDDENASGGSYLFSNLGITRDVPAGDGYELYADYTYDVNIPADGTYYVFLKYKNANYYWQGTHVTIDNNPYANYCGWQKIYSDWTWISTASASLKAGAHTVKITARKAYNYIDAICVTSDANFKGFITPETVVVEAEHTQFTPAKDGKLLYINGGGSADYSNGYYIANAGSWDTEDRTGFTPETAADVLYNVTVKEAGDYDLWFRSKEGASVSAHIEANGNNYPASYVSLSATTGYAWKKVKTLSLNAGDNKIGMIFRNPGMNIDMIAVTNDASFDVHPLNLYQ